MGLLFPARIGCFSLKETDTLLNIWCKIEIYFTRDLRKLYFLLARQLVKILLSMINCEINFYLTPTFNKYPLFTFPNINTKVLHYLRSGTIGNICQSTQSLRVGAPVAPNPWTRHQWWYSIHKTRLITPTGTMCILSVQISRYKSQQCFCFQACIKWIINFYLKMNAFLLLSKVKNLPCYLNKNKLLKYLRFPPPTIRKTKKF